MFLKGLFNVLCDSAGGGADGGGGGGGDAGAAAGGADGGAAGGTAPASGAAAQGAGAGADAGTALAQGAGDKHFIPEKYHVKAPDGTIDLEASSKKLGEAYGHLSARLGTGDVRPKTPDEYTVAVPDALKGKWDPKADPIMGEFLKEAHAAGYTQKQIDLAMGRYMEIAPKLVEGSRTLSADDCVADLRKEWKSEDQYKAETKKAYNAAVAYGGEDAQALIQEYGNDPRFIRMLNRIGGELGEDKAINPGAALPAGQTVEHLLDSEAYNNPKHVDHARVSKQVRDYFEAKAASDVKKSGSAILII